MKTRTITITYGRFQVLHDGHLLVFDELLKHKNHLAYISHTQGKNNPLSFEQKLHYIKLIRPDLNLCDDPTIRTPFQALKQLRDEGYTKINFVGGDDIVPFINRVKKYQNHPDPDKILPFQFNHIMVGTRKGAISATQMREFAQNNNFQEFKSNLFINNNITKQLFEDVKLCLLPTSRNLLKNMEKKKKNLKNIGKKLKQK